jgi:hypothetical protein
MEGEFMTELMAVVKLLESTHRDHMAGMTTSYTLIKEQKAIDQLKSMVNKRLENTDGMEM